MFEMLDVRFGAQFKKDLKLAKKRHLDINLLKTMIDIVMLRGRCYLEPHDKNTECRDESGLGRGSAGKEFCRGV